ncbi:hypothetical protein J4479_04540 [Candidatus Woesearchaeota archaeon]|nr:hypothetical protein [Candidatus Woesearchaeota archaeon]
MVNPKEFKKKIEVSISQDYKVEFLGKNFDQIANLVKLKKFTGGLRILLRGKLNLFLLARKNHTKNG